MKLFQEPCEVTGGNRQRWEIRWRTNSYRVLEVEESWLWVGRWWLRPDLAGERRRYFRVAVASAGGNRLVLEIFEQDEQWTLSRVED